MKRIHLVNVGTEDDPDYVATETESMARLVADEAMGVVEDFTIPLYEADDPMPQTVTVHWANFWFAPARDENGHELACRPGTVTVRTGTEEGLDAFISPPTTTILLGHRGWSAVATGWPTADHADKAARSRFVQELARRERTVTWS